MNFQTLKPYFTYTKSQRNGLLCLFAVIILIQVAAVCADFTVISENTAEKQKWLSLQTQFDSLARTKPRGYQIRPFNPNFINDFKGYQLGMTVAEIDRLLAFRKTDRYVNSAAEFQQVTKVSDSLLSKMSPLFKFPDWVSKKKKPYHKYAFEKTKLVVLDINQATQEDLKKVYGIGDGLSERILKEKEKLGGFVSMEQMNDVWGLSPEVIEKLNESFKIGVLPQVKKIKINEASIKELSQFPYFRYQLAKAIVTFRSMNGEIDCAEDLVKISGFPVEKVKIIALYLEF